MAFVYLADNPLYYPEIELSCQVLLQRPERFAKTAVGWILRELSQHDAPFVRRVIETNIQHFSAESLKNATKYLAKDEQKRYRELFKDS